VQKQPGAVLVEIIARHGNVPVYVEGLTDGGAEVFRLKAVALSCCWGVPTARAGRWRGTPRRRGTSG